MENPATWGTAEKIVNQTIDDFYKGKIIIGLSLTRQITDALRDAGLLEQAPALDQSPPEGETSGNGVAVQIGQGLTEGEPGQAAGLPC